MPTPVPDKNIYKKMFQKMLTPARIDSCTPVSAHLSQRWSTTGAGVESEFSLFYRSRSRVSITWKTGVSQWYCKCIVVIGEPHRLIAVFWYFQCSCRALFLLFMFCFYLSC